MISRGWALVFACSGLGLASPSFAAPGSETSRHGTVSVLWPACDSPPFDRVELERALDVELGSEGWALLRPARSDAPLPAQSEAVFGLLVEDCAADAADLTITLGLRGSEVRKVKLNLDDIPRASLERTLAVALTELLRVSRDDGALRSPEPVSRETDSAPDRLLEEFPESIPDRKEVSPLAWEALEVRGVVGRLSKQAPAFGGGGVGARFRLLGQLAPRIGLDVLASRASTAWGSVDLIAASLDVGMDIVFIEEPRLMVGPGLRTSLLAARAEGIFGVEEPFGVNFTLELTGRVLAGVSLGGPWSVFFVGEGGMFLRDVYFTAGSVRLIDFAGSALRGALGVAFHFER